jgi:hypothetical protein
VGGGRAEALLHACGGAFALFRALAGQIAGEAYDEKLGDQVHLLSPVQAATPVSRGRIACPLMAGSLAPWPAGRDSNLELEVK